MCQIISYQRVSKPYQDQKGALSRASKMESVASKICEELVEAVANITNVLNVVKCHASERELG